MSVDPCRNLTCSCADVVAARDCYEAAAADLRYRTTAAWVRWEDMPIDGRLTWAQDHARATCSCPTDSEIDAAIEAATHQLTRGGTNACNN